MLAAELAGVIQVVLDLKAWAAEGSALWRSGEAVGESAAQLQPKFLALCRCQYCGWPPRTSHVCCKAESEKWPKPFGGEESEWIPDIGHGVIYVAGVWFRWVQIVTLPLFFPLEIRKNLT